MEWLITLSTKITSGSKIYAVALSDISLILVSLFLDMEPYLKLVGIVIGVVVGIGTTIKLLFDIRKARDEYRIRRIERIRKEEEFEDYLINKHK